MSENVNLSPTDPAPSENPGLSEPTAEAQAEPQAGRQPRRSWWRRGLFAVLCVATVAVGINVAVQAVNLAAPPAASNLAAALPFGPGLAQATLAAQAAQVQLPASYLLPVSFGQLGPRLIAAGVIDPEAFAAALAVGDHPMTPAQQALLEQGSDSPVVVEASNAQFVLNFLWAVGLANQNPILLQGRMQADGSEQVLRYASTAGWTLAAKPIAEVYAALPLTMLTPVQQQRLETVAAAAYRPCCNNPTSFPDCNHGMALLGLLELMAAQDATEAQMFEAAKYVNAFWFPQQMKEAATLVKVQDGQDFAQADARKLVGSELFSSAGYATTHRWLAEHGYLPPQEGQGASCGV